MNESMDLNELKKFWQTLFEKENIAPQLASLVTEHADEGLLFNLPEYGEVLVKAKSASSLGDNFMSDTFITTVERTIQDDSATCKNTITHGSFIKVLPSNIMLRQAAYEMRTHHREINMYRHFFEHLREVNKNHPAISLDVPDVYYANLEEIVKDVSDGSGTCILLQDLVADGYRMSDKLSGADYHHCCLALKSLAHYHALTTAVLRQWIHPETGELTNIPSTAAFILEKTPYETPNFELMKGWSTCLTEFTQDINRPDLTEWFADLMNRMPEIFKIDDLKSSGQLACILHGDFWNNNMLFKYASHNGDVSSVQHDVPVSIKMIDFQVSRIGHPASDILYFLYTSAAPETREKYMEALLRLYYDTLTTDLQQLGVDIESYSWEDFRIELKTRSLRFMIISLMIMCMVLNKKAVQNLEDLDLEERIKRESNDVYENAGSITMEQQIEESMKTMNEAVTSIKLSENALLSHRLEKLLIEVKALNDD